MLRARPAHEVGHRASRPADGGDVGALVVEHRHGHAPAVVLPAQQVARGHAHVLEEDLVEVVAVGDVGHGLHGHAGGAHVEDEGADAAVLARLRVRAREHDHLVRQVRVRRPDLLAVEHVVVAVAHGARGQRGEVAARLRLAEALAVPGRAGGHLRQQARLLLVRAVGQHRGPGDADGEEPPAAGRALPGQLLVQDHLLQRRRAHAAVLARPGGREPGALAQLLHEGAREGGVFLVVEEIVVALEAVGQLVAQEGAQLVAPAFGFVGKAKVHAAQSTAPARAGYGTGVVEALGAAVRRRARGSVRSRGRAVGVA